MRKCEKCNRELGSSDIIYWRCPICGKVFSINFGKLKSLRKQKQGNPGCSLVKCPECGISLDDGNEVLAYKCAECGSIMRGNFFVSSAEQN